MAERANQISNYERCTMCLLILVEQTEVIELPCEHLVCSRCLTERNRTVRGVKCSVENCQMEHGKLDINALKVVFVQYACETDGCSSQADWFCPSCIHMLCSKHRKGHDSILSKHKEDVISLADYKADSEKLAPRMCRVEGHSKERVRMACIKCLKPICERCVHSAAVCNEDEQGKHDVKFAEELETVYNERYKNIAERLANFESDMIGISKKAWVLYDEFEQHNDRVSQEIKSIAKAMIEKIEEASKTLSGEMTGLSGFYYYETKETDEKAEKLKNRAKDEQVTVTELASRNVLDSIQKPELISDAENIAEEATPHVSEIPKFTPININSVLSTNSPGKFVSTPEHQLTYKHTLEGGEKWGSVLYVHGELITGGIGTIGGLTNELKITGHIISMCLDEENPSHIYILSGSNINEKYTFLIHQLNIITLKIEQLNTFTAEGNLYRYITVVNDHLAVTNYPNLVKIFTKHTGQHQYNITLNEQKGGLHDIDHLPDGTIVVLNYETNTVLNITLDRESQVIWKIELTSPAAISVNRADGYILVSHYSQNKISLLNYRGES